MGRMSEILMPAYWWWCLWSFLQEYTEEIERLRRDLQASRDKNGIYLAQENYEALTTEILQQKDQLATMEEKMDAINLELIKVPGFLFCFLTCWSLHLIEILDSNFLACFSG